MTTSTTTATELRTKADEADRRAEESFQRSDTDGFLSQWASNLSARKYRLDADIIENGGTANFVGLYDGDRRVAAKLIPTQYGTCWLLRDDEARAYGRKFVPLGEGSRVQKRLGLCERDEQAPARADVVGGNGRGLSGAASCYVAARRSGDEWGTDATPEEA